MLNRTQEWDRYEIRLNVGIEKILKVLDAYNTKATFFVLGHAASRSPDILKSISEKGHEIACHGYWHQFVFRKGRREFEADLKRSLETIESICGIRPVGYRASTFSIRHDCLWAFEILAENGIKYDSSINPLYYGARISSKERFPVIHNIIEVPVSTVTIAGVHMPFSGGFFLRVFPFWMIRKAFTDANAGNAPVSAYVHPWEFDRSQPRLYRNPLVRFLRYWRLAATPKKLESLLQNFRFSTMRDLLCNAGMLSL